MNPFREIKVFISSRCEGDYAPVRAKLSRLLNNSPAFESFIFESQGAASCSARESYIRALVDSDVCVFIVRYEDGLSDGVLDEIDCAFRHKKRSLFYFCGFEGGLPSELQNRLSRSDMSVYQRNINALEDVPQMAFEDLQRDVLEMYRACCNGLFEFNEGGGTSLPSDLSSPKDAYLPRRSLHSVNACMSVLNRFLLLSHDKEIPESNELDVRCSDLMRRMLFVGDVSSFQWKSLIEAVQSAAQGQYDAEVVECRWLAISAYYKQDYRGALKHMEAAYEKAQENNVADWLIKDILIDLRNIESAVAPFSCNYQKNLDESETAISYPLLDRAESEFYGALIKAEKKAQTESIYTVTIGDNLQSIVERVVQMIVIAASYGSLTHLLLVRERLETLAIHLCERYGKARFGLLLLKIMLCSGDAKRIERALQSMGGMDSIESSEEAYAAYEYVYHCAPPVSRQAGLFEAFHHLGCYMRGADYVKASALFMAAAQEYMSSDMVDWNVGRALFQATRANLATLDFAWVLEQCEKALKKGRLETSEEALKTISYSNAQLRNVDPDKLRLLVGLIGESAQAHKNFLSFEAAKALVGVARAVPELQQKCRNCAEQYLNERAAAVFSIETSLDDENFIIEQIEGYVEGIEQDNATQGVGGAWAFSAIAEYENAGILLRQLDNPPSLLIQRTAKAAVGTLHGPTQLLSSKAKACVLLLELLALPSVSSVDDLGITNDDLLFSQAGMVSAPMIGENDSLLSSSIFFESLLCGAGLARYERLEAALIETYSARGFDQAKAALALKHLLRALKPSDVPGHFRSFLFAYAASLYQSPLFQVRLEAIQLLFEMLDLKGVGKDVARQLVDSYSEKSPNERCRIIRQQETIRVVNESAWRDLKRKALGDNCSISRNVAEELFAEEG